MEGDKIEPQITATWAREKANEIMSENAKNQLFDCLTRIKEAVAKNQMSAYVNTLDDIVKQELAKRGFVLEFKQRYDQRDPSYYTIKW
jgi:hypothetical protein